MFYNFTNQDFTVTWGKKAYTFSASGVFDGIVISDDKTESVNLTPAVCEVFAHHLATKVLNDPSVNTNRGVDGKLLENAHEQMLTYNITSLDALKSRAQKAPSVYVEIPPSVEALALMQGVEKTEAPVEEVEAPVVEKKRSPGRPKKEVASPSPEAELAM